MKSIEEIQSLLGKHVRVVVSYNDPEVVVEGKLLSFDEGGGFVVLDEMGFKHYCWPLLEIEEGQKEAPAPGRDKNRGFS